VIEYRHVEPSDHGEIRQFLATNGWETRVADLERFELMMRNASRTVAAVDGEMIVGFARALTDDVSNGYLGTVVVAPAVVGASAARWSCG
jgi:hypothetical protein